MKKIAPAIVSYGHETTTQSSFGVCRSKYTSFHCNVQKTNNLLFLDGFLMRRVFIVLNSNYLRKYKCVFLIEISLCAAHKNGLIYKILSCKKRIKTQITPKIALLCDWIFGKEIEYLCFFVWDL